MKPKPPSDLWEQMELARQKCGLTPPPEGAITATRYATQYGVSVDAAKRELRKLESSGALRCWGTFKGCNYFLLVN